MDPLEDIQMEVNTGLKVKSTFNPPLHSVPPQVLAFENAVLQDVASSERQTHLTFNNLSKAEHKALESLAKDDSITIKPADKGGSIVIQDTCKYRAECLRQLSDERHYLRLTEDPTERLLTTISNYVEEALMEGWITQNEARFLNQPFLLHHTSTLYQKYIKQ